jgi:hypothetical protein
MGVVRKQLFIVFCAAAVALGAAAGAEAQHIKYGWTPLNGRVFFDINALTQSGEQTVERGGTVDLYEETGDFRSRQTIKGSSLMDIGGGVRLMGTWPVLKDFGVGLHYTRFTTFGTADISGSLPHPLVFDRPRAYSAQTSDLIHKEQAVHLSLYYFLPYLKPYVKNLDVAVFVGPSFFNDVDQDFPIGITFSEIPPEFNSVTLDEVREGRASGTTGGYNIGFDVHYLIAPNVAAGVTFRQTKASIDFDVGGITTPLDVGGPQIGAGIRLRF